MRDEIEREKHTHTRTRLVYSFGVPISLVLFGGFVEHLYSFALLHHSENIHKVNGFNEQICILIF